ncbi:MAG: cyclase family protein [Caldilineae bacterium]|nr:cyclase family protein [Chloroflexota bacterium]MCB9175756.1 cyclase family protein [Caldilineae bacterium]
MPGSWIDISLPIEPASTAWSGLPGPTLRALSRIEDGAAVQVGQLDCCLHTGTHADAPAHVLANGRTVDRLDPGAFVGPALLLHIEAQDRIGQDELRRLGLDAIRGRPEAARILVATPRPFDGRHFPTRIPHLEPEAAEYLIWLGARLVGVDQPSIDPLDSQSMPAHKLLFGADACLLENLDFGRLRPGAYELAAAPIRIRGADAAPVRALLRPRG